MDADQGDLRKFYVYMANMAAVAERFDDMAEWMKKVAKLAVELSTEEKSFLSTAYKKIIDRHRSAWSAVYSFEQDEKTKSNNDHLVKRVKDYRHEIEEDLSKVAKDILTLINDYLVPSARTPESIVFYYKLKGDYLRYLAEFKLRKEEIQEAFEESFNAYDYGLKLARDNLAPTNDVRLGLAFNFAVLFDDILYSPGKAWSTAQEAYIAATADLGSLSEESNKQSTSIIQHLKAFCDDCYVRIETISLTADQNIWESIENQAKRDDHYCEDSRGSHAESAV